LPPDTVGEVETNFCSQVVVCILVGKYCFRNPSDDPGPTAAAARGQMANKRGLKAIKSTPDPFYLSFYLSFYLFSFRSFTDEKRAELAVPRPTP
jgi:hypothetical protein